MLLFQKLIIIYALSYFGLLDCYPLPSSLNDRDLLIQELDQRVKLKINKKSGKWAFAGACTAVAGGVTTGGLGAFLSIPAVIKALKLSRERDNLKEEHRNAEIELYYRDLSPLDIDLDGLNDKADLVGVSSFLGGMIIGDFIDIPISGMMGKLINEAIQQSLTDRAGDAFMNQQVERAMAACNLDENSCNEIDAIPEWQAILYSKPSYCGKCSERIRPGTFWDAHDINLDDQENFKDLVCRKCPHCFMHESDCGYWECHELNEKEGTGICYSDTKCSICNMEKSFETFWRVHKSLPDGDVECCCSSDTCLFCLMNESDCGFWARHEVVNLDGKELINCVEKGNGDTRTTCPHCMMDIVDIGFWEKHEASSDGNILCY